MNTQSILHKGGTRLDIVLDSSEYYDYELGDNTKDFTFNKALIPITNNVLTEDDYILTTEDNFNLQWQ